MDEEVNDLVIEKSNVVKRRAMKNGSKDDGEFQTELPDVILVDSKNPIGSGRKHTADERFAKDPRYKKHGWHTDAKKMEVACAYAVTGNSRRVAEMTGLPEGTIRAWKQTEWWNDIQSRIRTEANEELDTKLTKILDKTVAEINDRLENGDYVYNAHQDKLVRKPVGAKEMTSIMATTVDKRQLLRGEPTSRVQKVSENEKLVRLAEQFKNFAMAKEITSVATEIEFDNEVARESAIENESIVDGNA